MGNFFHLLFHFYPDYSILLLKIQTYNTRRTEVIVR